MRNKLKQVILLLGSNLGNKHRNISTALALLEHGMIKVDQVSSVYETEPWGIADQPSFYNCSVLIKTGLLPADLLTYILNTERQMGRVRKEKWGERVIDIDILFYEDQVVNSGELKIPHPEFENRRFAIIPVMEILPLFIHPVTKKTIREINNECRDNLEVGLVKLKS